MDKQVLLIEQMQALEKLGIDTTKASLYWIESFYFDEKNNNERIIMQSVSLIPTTNAIPTFTIQDILEILPKYLNVKDNTYFLTLMYDASKGVVISYCTEHIMNILHSEGSNNQLNAFFNMLIWCKQNNYI